jgi:hypothetical protein
MKVSSFRRKIFSTILIIALTFSVFAVSIPQIRFVYAAEVFSDGFESGYITQGEGGAWNGTSVSSGCTAEVGSTNVREGSYSAEFTTDNAYENAYAYVDGLSLETAYVRQYIYVPEIPESEAYALSGIYGTSNTMVRPYIRNNGGTYQWGIRWYDGSWQSVDWSIQHEPQVGNFYHFEPYFHKGDGDGEAKLYVGGEELTDITHTGLDANETVTKCGVGIVADSSTYGGTFYIDAVNISTTYVGDTLNPVEFSDFGISTKVASTVSSISMYASIESGNLSHFYIETTNTGSWTSESIQSFGAGLNESLMSDTITLNSTGKQTIQVKFHANNTDGVWSISETQSFTTLTLSTISRISVNGTRFENSTGDTYQLAGVHWADLADDNKFYYGPWVEDWVVDVDNRTAVAKAIGANHIRLSIQLEGWANPFTYNGTHYYDNYREVVDAWVQALIDNDMYGYICFHYGSSGHNPFMIALLDNTDYNFTISNDGSEVGYYYSTAVRDDWMNWSTQIAEYYKDVPNVMGYQIWAEPAWGEYQSTQNATAYDLLFKDWWEFNNDTIAALQDGNSDVISWVVNAGHYSTTYMTPNHWDGRHGAGYGTLPYDNVVYSIQKYESEDYRGGASQQAYSDAYEDWYNGTGSLDTARELQEDWYYEFCFNFSINEDVPVFNTEFAYVDDMEYNDPNAVDWAWQREQAQGFYDIWKNYSQCWTQHRWQIGTTYGGGGSYWGFFEDWDDPDVGDYTLAPSGDLLQQTLHNTEYKNLGYPYVFSTVHLTNVTYNPDTYVMNVTVNMTSLDYSNYSITKIYCGARGTPSEVTGEESYSYDDGTTMLTVNASHASAASLGIAWETKYLTIGSATGGSCNVTVGEHSYANGTVVYVQATASSGYSFANWTLDAGDGGTDNPLAVTMAANHTLTPVFVADSSEPTGGAPPSSGDEDESEDIPLVSDVVDVADGDLIFGLSLPFLVWTSILVSCSVLVCSAIIVKKYEDWR